MIRAALAVAALAALAAHTLPKAIAEVQHTRATWEASR